MNVETIETIKSTDIVKNTLWERVTHMLNMAWNKTINFVKKQFHDFSGTLARVSSDTVEWVGIIALHGATIPTMLGLMMGITDNTPSIDIVLILWAALTMFFIKAVIKKDILNIITIGLGFIGQATMLALIFFK